MGDGNGGVALCGGVVSVRVSVGCLGADTWRPGGPTPIYFITPGLGQNAPIFGNFSIRTPLILGISPYERPSLMMNCPYERPF